MTKTDIVNAVMGTFANVQNVEVDDEAGKVTITVTTDLLRPEEIYNLRVGILERLEPERPMGVGFDVQMKRFDDGTLIIFGVVQSGPSSRTVMMFSAAEAMEAFGTRSEEYEKALATFGSAYDGREPRRTRFEAIALELTEHIAPLKKPSPSNEPKLNAPQLFEQVIDVAYGKLSPCPKCECQAFEPNNTKDRVICRGCPIPPRGSPRTSYPLNFSDKSGFDTKRYKCGSCGAQTMVTMTLSQINLYCVSCSKLTLQDLQEEPKKETKVFSGSKAIFTFNGVKIEGFASGVEILDEVVEYEPINAMELYKGDLPPSKGFTATFTVDTEGPSNWMGTIEKLSQRVSAEYGMTYEQLTSSPAAQLMEMFREKLNLLPFNMYEQQQRNENIVRGLSERDRDRRTGRTTRGLIRTIAEFAVSNLRILCVVGHTERYTKDLLNLAREMVMKINLARRIDIKPIAPSDFDMSYDYTRTQSALVYVDHTYRERNIR